MAYPEKKAERSRKAAAYREFARSLTGDKPSASSIFQSLSGARVNQRHATSSRLARETLFGENPEAALPEELSDKAISQYLADAGSLYGSAATDYVCIADLAMALKYFRKAAKHYSAAAGFATETGAELLERARDYRDKAAIVRQQLAGRSVRRRRCSLGLLKRRG